jgi:hypothetical protein
MIFLIPLLSKLGAVQWRKLLGFVSPSFFKIVPMGELVETLKRGVQFSKDSKRIEDLIGILRSRIQSQENTQDAALFLYFYQILGDGDCLLDLSAEAFSVSLKSEKGTISENPVPILTWKPNALRYVFSPPFLQALQKIYTGFYCDDANVFEEGLKALGLQKASPLFRKHFGEGDGTQVEFRVAQFVDHFHQIFEECRRKKLTLGGEFAALGIFLATLYEHLDEGSQTRTWNVKKAFLDAQRMRNQ